MWTLSINSASTSYRYIVCIFSEEDMPLVRMAQQRWPWLPAVFVDIQASKNRTGLRIERDITLQNDRARQINARTQVDNTSAGFRTSINRSIDCRRIQLFSVAHGAELPRFKEHRSFPLAVCDWPRPFAKLTNAAPQSSMQVPFYDSFFLLLTSKHLVIEAALRDGLITGIGELDLVKKHLRFGILPRTVRA
jgi:hypothetical protein